MDGCGGCGGGWGGFGVVSGVGRWGVGRRVGYQCIRCDGLLVIMSCG